MNIARNIVIERKNEKPIVLDFGYKVSQFKKPVIIFAHGFKGFKDWGHFNKVMDYFIENDFAFLKFNFSHNGGTVDEPIDFPDLEAFGNNNYTKELADLKTVVDWVAEIDNKEVDTQQIYLIGHSRGGGIAILGSYEDQRIKKLVTWAAVSDLINRYTEEQMVLWKKDGVMLIPNSRTKQQMPLYYQLVEDVLTNTNRFNIEQVAKQLTLPYLIIHGSADEVVSLSDAQKINSWAKNAAIHIIEGGDHTFGGKHPFTDKELPGHVQQLLMETLKFLKK